MGRPQVTKGQVIIGAIADLIRKGHSITGAIAVRTIGVRPNSIMFEGSTEGLVFKTPQGIAEVVRLTKTRRRTAGEFLGEMFRMMIEGRIGAIRPN